MFPVLAKCDALPQHILQILRHVDPSKHTQGLSKKLTNFDELTLKSFPNKVEEILQANPGERAKVLHRLAVLYHHHDVQQTAESLYRKAMEAANQMVTKSNPELGLIMNNLGRLLHGQGKLAEARALYQKSLEILEQRLGAEHPRLATPLSNAAQLAWDMGEPERAQRLSSTSLVILTSALGPEHPKVLKARKKLDAMKQRTLAPV